MMADKMCTYNIYKAWLTCLVHEKFTIKALSLSGDSGVGTLKMLGGGGGAQLSCVVCIRTHIAFSP